jgi:hypothetical protein
VDQQPLVRVAPAAATAADEREASAQFLAVEVDVEIAAFHHAMDVLAVGRFEGAAVPDDHVAPAVLTGRDDTFEVEILDGMIFDVLRQAARLRIERRTLRHRPTHEHAVDLQPEVVVKAAGAMPLHDEPAGAFLYFRAARLGRRVELPLVAVPRE